MAKLVDAVDSKSTSSNRVQVRVLSSAKQKRESVGIPSFVLPMKNANVLAFLRLEAGFRDGTDASSARQKGVLEAVAEHTASGKGVRGKGKSFPSPSRSALQSVG